jgi:hypothetical protein
MGDALACCLQQGALFFVCAWIAGLPLAAGAAAAAATSSAKEDGVPAGLAAPPKYPAWPRASKNKTEAVYFFATNKCTGV